MNMKNTFRFASLLMAAVMLFASCGEGPLGNTGNNNQGGNNTEQGGNDNTGNNGGGNTENETGTLTLEVDKLIIQSNGEDVATLKVLFNDKVITEGVTIYDNKNKKVELVDFKFTTETPGEYGFWANYKTFNSNDVKITAVATEVPSTPEDPQASNTSFVRRVLLTKITGAGCVACPNVTAALHEIMEDEAYAPYFIKAEAHTFESGYDPAQLTGFYSVTSWPTVIVDWAMSFVPTSGVVTQRAIENMIKERYEAEDAKAGIAVNSKCENGAITLKVCVKAAETDEYCVGAWLLEDGIEGTQSGAPTGEGNEYYHVFDDCIRIADSKRAAGAYSGHKLGEIAAGKTAEKMFIWTLKDAWKVENLQLCVFVSAPNEDGVYVVNNVINAPVNGEVKYEYKK